MSELLKKCPFSGCLLSDLSTIFMQANILEEVFYSFNNIKTTERLAIQSSLATIRNTKVQPSYWFVMLW